MKDYPAVLMQTLICCIIVTIQSATVSLVAEKDPNAWRLRPDIELIAMGYSVRAQRSSMFCSRIAPSFHFISNFCNDLVCLFISRPFLGYQFEVLFTHGHVTRRGLSMSHCLSPLELSLQLSWGSLFLGILFILEGIILNLFVNSQMCVLYWTLLPMVINNLNLGHFD